MREKIIDEIVRLHHYLFVKVIRTTLIMLFPIALVGTIAKMLLKTIFEPAGFIYNIANLYVIPQNVVRVMQFMLTSVTQLTLGVIGIYAIYLAAYFTAKHYQRAGHLAGLTGIMTLLVMSYRYNRLPTSLPVAFYRRLLGGNSLLLGLVVGFAIGQLFRWLTPTNNTDGSTPVDQQQAFSAFKPMVIAVLCAVIIALFLNSYSLYNAWATTYSGLVVTAQEHHHLWLTVLATLAITGMDWLGLGEPYNYAAMTGSLSFTENLNYALAHGSAWGVPYKYLGSSLYNSFANFGGDGLVLALIVAVLVTSNGSYLHRVARWTALPTLFNFNYATMIGLPIVFNPVIILPFMFLPVFNILVAGLAITVHLIPSTPYPVLQGTPGPLISFLGTNGNWGILLFTIALLMIDIIAYIPFVKLALAVEQRLENEQDVVQHG